MNHLRRALRIWVPRIPSKSFKIHMEIPTTEDQCSRGREGVDGTRWAPTSYKWSYNLYKWPYECPGSQGNDHFKNSPGWNCVDEVNHYKK